MMMLTRLQWYALREILRIGAISLVALTAVIFVGFSVSLVQRGVNILQISPVVPYIAKMSLPYSIPAAALLATVFVFGRLSGTNEIGAMRSSGVNVNYIIWWPLIVGVLICGASFYLNHFMLPTALERIRTLRDEVAQKVALKVGRTLKEYQLGRYTIYVGGVDPVTETWVQVAVIVTANELPSQIMFARRGSCVVNEEAQTATLILEEGNIVHPSLQGKDTRPPVQFRHVEIKVDLRDDRVRMDKAKYRTLPRLMELISELSVQSEQIRKEQEFRAVRHPDTEGKKVEAEADKLYRRWTRLSKPAQETRATVVALSKEAEAIQGELRTATATRDTKLENRKDVGNALAGLKAQQEQILGEMEQLKRDEAGADRLARAKTELAGVESRLKDQQAKYDIVAAEATAAESAAAVIQTGLDRKRAEIAEAESIAQTAERRADLAWLDYNAEDARAKKFDVLHNLLRARVEMNFRNAMSLTPLVFMLIGIPLGILSRHGNVIMAFVVSFFAVLIIYYPLVAIGIALSEDGFAPSLPMQWAPNIIVGFLGIALLAWRVRR